MKPVSVFDVASFILYKKGEMTTMKLQKLVYYCQAWSLVWDSEPLFKESIEAWANGPIVRELYKEHKGEFKIASLAKGNPEILAKDQRQTVEAVLDFYGDKTPHYLSNLTHAEDPWRNAREGLAPGQRGHRQITHDAMAEYYEGLSS